VTPATLTNNRRMGVTAMEMGIQTTNDAVTPTRPSLPPGHTHSLTHARARAPSAFRLCLGVIGCGRVQSVADAVLVDGVFRCGCCRLSRADLDFAVVLTHPPIRHSLVVGAGRRCAAPQVHALTKRDSTRDQIINRTQLCKVRCEERLWASRQ
jgi:hypothetical protein